MAPWHCGICSQRCIHVGQGSVLWIFGKACHGLLDLVLRREAITSLYFKWPAIFLESPDGQNCKKVCAGWGWNPSYIDYQELGWWIQSGVKSCWLLSNLYFWRRKLYTLESKVSSLRVDDSRLQSPLMIVSTCKKLMAKSPLKYCLVNNLKFLDPRLLAAKPEQCIGPRWSVRGGRVWLTVLELLPILRWHGGGEERCISHLHSCYELAGYFLLLTSLEVEGAPAYLEYC